MRGIGLLGALVVVLLLSGVLDVDDDRFMVVFMALAVLAMLFVVPGAMGQRAELVAAHPLLQLHPDGFAHGGSEFPAAAVVGMSRSLVAHLGSLGVPYVDCGCSQQDVERAETELSRR
ncbi:hypothetical protein [Janibacter melonis]|uniref:hypothetical protein n=1 Tax=Janibacter melonis TaxID=262209 RepID=UPI0017870981|nr:hypothetical protein [Janibacter melonis]